VCVCVPACVRACSCVRVCVRVPARVHACAWCVCVPCACACACACACTCTRACACVHACMRACIFRTLHACAYVHTFVPYLLCAQYVHVQYAPMYNDMAVSQTASEAKVASTSNGIWVQCPTLTFLHPRETRASVRVYKHSAKLSLQGCGLCLSGITVWQKSLKQGSYRQRPLVESWDLLQSRMSIGKHTKLSAKGKGGEYGGAPVSRLGSTQTLNLPQHERGLCATTGAVVTAGTTFWST
jgi:hypothetical protein